MKSSGKWLWLGAFTLVFAVLAAFVFWGTWSPDFAPVMPDDGVWHPLALSDQFDAWFRSWLSGGQFVPMDLAWNGILVSKYWLQEFKYVLGLFIASLGLAAFLRGRGLSCLASCGAGLFLGFCGYWMTLFSAGHGGWFMIMACIIPAFAFMDRVAVSGRISDGLLLGAFAGWGTCRQPDLFFLFAVFLAVYGVYACVRERRFPWKAGLAALALFAVVGAPGIRGAFVGSLKDRDKQIEEAKGSALAGGKGAAAGATDAEKKKADDEVRWIFVTNWSLPVGESLEFFIPRLNGDTSCPMTLQLGHAAGRDVKPYTGALGRPLGASRGNYRQHSLYVGWVTCLLALVAVIVGIGWPHVGAFLRNAPEEMERSDARLRISEKCAHGRRDILFFALAALVFWLFSLGRNFEPLYRLVYQMPFGDYLRGPVKWHHLTEFSLCVLAGFGIDALWGWLRARGCGEKIAFALVAALVVFGATDLARVDRLYCAPIDLTAVRARNAAADEILRRGKGPVADLLAGGNGVLSWSFGARGIGMVADPATPGVRFVWTSLELMKRNPQLAAWLKRSATPAGLYLVTARGISGASPDRANAALYQMNGVPPSPEPPAGLPSVDPLVLTLGLVSLAGTLLAAACLVKELLISLQLSQRMRLCV